jgi:hypothetical protein
MSSPKPQGPLDLSNVRLIGISGKMGAGKDTVGAFLFESLNHAIMTMLVDVLPLQHIDIMSQPVPVLWRPKAFASHLKKVVATMVSAEYESFLTEAGKNKIYPV